MKLITLAKKLDFNTETEYFDYCINSYINGNFTQCRKLFSDMTKKDRKRLIEYIANCHPCGTHSKEYIWYWNIL